jgi:hypothetical protein
MIRETAYIFVNTVPAIGDAIDLAGRCPKKAPLLAGFFFECESLNLLNIFLTHTFKAEFRVNLG